MPHLHQLFRTCLVVLLFVVQFCFSPRSTPLLTSAICMPHCCALPCSKASIHPQVTRSNNSSEKLPSSRRQHLLISAEQAATAQRYLQQRNEKHNKQKKKNYYVATSSMANDLCDDSRNYLTCNANDRYCRRCYCQRCCHVVNVCRRTHIYKYARLFVCVIMHATQSANSAHNFCTTTATPTSAAALAVANKCC